MKEEIKAELSAMKEELTAQLTEIKDQLPSLKKDIIKEVRGVMGEVMEKFDHGEQAIPATVQVQPIKQDIVIAAGVGTQYCLSSVETFSWNQRTWTPVPPLKNPRSEAKSCIYKNQIIVMGGYSGGTHFDDMEVMKIDQEPLKWVTFPAKLPDKCSGYRTVVYKDRVLVIGGYNESEGRCNTIHEVLLIPPYSTKLLCRMPEPREYHGTELINDKVFILGGYTNESTNSVIMYDIIKNECKPMRALPYVVNGMATVSWRNKVILMGGTNEQGRVLNDIMYDTVTGESEMLPSMKCKRHACSAVITANVIVVMGGMNNEDHHLNSVECFSVGRYSWQPLPPMIEGRLLATSVVKPQC